MARRRPAYSPAFGGNLTKYSFSSLSTYTQCSLKYYFNYVLNINFEEQTPALFLGSLCHEMFEHHYRNDCKTTREEIKNLFLNRFDAGIILEDVQGSFPKQIEYNRDMGLRVIDQFFDNPDVSKVKPLVFKNKDGKEEPAIEMYFRIPMIDLKTGEDFGIELSGIIDVVDGKGRKIRIKDHKTSSKEYSDFFIETSLQLTMYAYAIRYLAMEGKLKSKAKKEHNVGYNMFMKPKNQNAAIYIERKIEEEDLQNMYRTINNVHKGIQNEIFIPANNDACEAFQGCPYMGICGKYQRNEIPFRDSKLVDRDFLLSLYPGKVTIR